MEENSSFDSAFKDLYSRYRDLSILEGQLKTAFNILTACFEQGNKLLTAGNGGSASDAEHIVGELVKSFAYNRPMSESDIAQLKNVSPDSIDGFVKHIEGSLPAISLMSPLALNSAYGNDQNFDYAIAQQVYGLGQEGDVFLGITTSGNSKNIVNAAIMAKSRGMKVIGLTGETGGKLKEYSDICICAPAQQVHIVQEFHLPIYHMLCFALEDYFFGKHGIKGSSKAAQAVEEKAQKIKPADAEMFIFDFDGVFTDNSVLTLQDGTEAVYCSRGDGLGLDYLRKANKKMMILSTEKNSVVAARANKLKMDYHHGCDNKQAYLIDYFKENNIDASKVVYVGNDLNDLGAMEIVGLTCCPSDSHPTIKRVADIVLNSRGGQGVIRELTELIL